MIALPLTEGQVFELVKQLPPETKRRIVEDLNAERDSWWGDAAREGEQDMRRIARERGLDWDALSDDQRERMVDDLLHEPDSPA